MILKHLKYASYVFRHKWYVFVAACRLRIPWRGFWHDMSKFRWDEWHAYAYHFYGPQSHHKDGTHSATALVEMGGIRPFVKTNAAAAHALYKALGYDTPVRDVLGYYKNGPARVGLNPNMRNGNGNGNDPFDAAWLKHLHRNPHHWQHWVLREDSGGTKVLEMSDTSRREMLADWMGAGKALGFGDNPVNWFIKNRKHMVLHLGTVFWLEEQLSLPHEAEWGEWQ